MRAPALVFLLALLGWGGPLQAEPPGSASSTERDPLLFVVPVDYPTQVAGSLLLVESLRAFGGELNQAPVHLYLHPALEPAVEPYRSRLDELSAQIRTADVPEDAMAYVLGAKPFTMAQAEREAEARYERMAVLAPNTIVLAEPRAFLVGEGASIAYSPVHHQNVGSLASEEPDAYWSRLYELLEIDEETIYSVRSMADEKDLRLYYNAGSFVVRPERGILREWARCFERLYGDPAMAKMCEEEPRNVFLHQAALSGATLRLVSQPGARVLPPSYSYPLFFDRHFGGEKAFDSLLDVVTMRYEFRFEELPAGWENEVEAPAGILDWIRTHGATP